MSAKHRADRERKRGRCSGRVWLHVAVAVALFVCVTGGSKKEESQKIYLEAQKLQRPMELEQRLALLKKALVLNPDNTLAARSLALSSAQRLLQARLPDNPQHAMAVEVVSAIDAYRTRALPKEKNSKGEAFSMCNLLVDIGHRLEGVDRPLLGLEMYLASNRIDPEHGNTLGSLYKVREWLCDWDAGGGRDKAFAELMTIVRAQLGVRTAQNTAQNTLASYFWDSAVSAHPIEEKEPPPVAVQTSLQPLTSLSQNLSPRFQLYIARAWAHAQVGRVETPHVNRFLLAAAKVAKLRDNQVKVGYISADMRGHAVSHQMMAVFRRHHRSSRVHTVLLNTFAGDPGQAGRTIKGYVDVWLDLAHEHGESFAATANKLKIHVLVDLAGHTFGARLSALARRPAPVSMTYLGYGSTTGAPFIDYIITDRVVSPPESTSDYSEALALMSHSFYPLNLEEATRKAPTRQQEGLPTVPQSEGGPFVWACFNRNLKIKPDVWAVWMALLRGAPPGTVLWLRRFHQRVEEKLKEHARAAQVSADRLVFAGRMPDHAAHLARHVHADLFLDTAPFGGHSTLADVVVAAIPSLVLPRSSMASRIGASLLCALGGHVFVARGLEEYGGMAAAWSRKQHARRLAAYRRAFNDTLRGESSPFAASAYTDRLEDMYRLAYETFRARREDAIAAKSAMDARAATGGSGSVVLDASALDAFRRKAPGIIYTRSSARPHAPRAPAAQIEEEDKPPSPPASISSSGKDAEVPQAGIEEKQKQKLVEEIARAVPVAQLRELGVTTGQTAQGAFETAVENGDKRLLQILKAKDFSEKLSELHQDCEAALGGANIKKKIGVGAAASPDTEMAKALKALLDAQSKVLALLSQHDIPQGGQEGGAGGGGLPDFMRVKA